MWKTQSLPKCSARERAKLAQPSKYSQPGPVRRVESAQPELPCQGPVWSGNSFLQLLRRQPWGLNAFYGTRPFSVFFFFFSFFVFFLFLRFCSREQAQQHFKKARWFAVLWGCDVLEPKARLVFCNSQGRAGATVQVSACQETEC